nr:MAG TPA: hypothetical protein [Caudoviricetes sp.]DAW58229.1 MAG TPA: hypothetical protein [Caudoviricetes sp.]
MLSQQPKEQVNKFHSCYIIGLSDFQASRSVLVHDTHGTHKISFNANL